MRETVLVAVSQGPEDMGKVVYQHPCHTHNRAPNRLFPFSKSMGRADMEAGEVRYLEGELPSQRQLGPREA